MNSGYALSRLTVIVSLSLFAAGRLLAADLTWDATPGDAISDGSGTWLDPGQWNDGSPNASWSNSTPDNAIIGVGGGAAGSDMVITLNSVTAGSVAFNNFAGTYVLTNGSLTVNDTITIATNAGNVTLYTPVSGAADITKDNTGALLLYGTNSFTGDISINAGALTIGNNNSAATLGASPTNAGNIFIASGAGLVFNNSTSQVLIGDISGGGTLQKAGSGTLTLSGNNTYSGKTTIAATGQGGPTVSVSSFNSVNGGTPLLASSSLGAPTTVASGTIDLGSGSNVRNCTLTYTGAGETTDRRINVSFNSGSQQTIYANVTGGGLLKFTSAFTINPSSGTTGSRLTLRGSGNGEIAGGFAAALPGILEKADAGTWTIGEKANPNTLLVSNGTLNLNGTNATGVSSNTIAVTGGTLNLNATNAISTRPVTLSGAGRVNANAPYALGSCAITVTNSATLALTVDLGLMSTNRLTITGAGNVQLDAGVRATVGSLLFGTNSMAVGSWGSIGSSTDHTSTNFTGAGKLFVGVDMPGDGTMVIVQ